MKHNTITIYPDTIIGSKIGSSKIVNLSSLSVSAIKVLLSRLDAKTSSYHFMKVVGEKVFSADTGKAIDLAGKRRTKLFVTMIVDDDDKAKNAKVRNQIQLYKYVIATLIIFKAKPGGNDTQDKVGTEIRVGHIGHKKEIKELLQIKDVTYNTMMGVSRCIVVSTNDDRAGSIAGILVYLRSIGIPHKIEKVDVKYTESILSTSRRVKTLTFPDIREACDYNPDNDSKWFYKTGYGDYLMTDKGPKKPEINVDQNNKSGSSTGMYRSKLHSFYLTIIRVFTMIIDMLVNMMDWIIKMLTKQNKRATTKNKTKDDSSERQTGGKPVVSKQSGIKNPPVLKTHDIIEAGIKEVKMHNRSKVLQSIPEDVEVDVEDMDQITGKQIPKKTEAPEHNVHIGDDNKKYKGTKRTSSKRAKNKDENVKLAFSIVVQAPNIAIAITNAAVASIPRNASKDIRAANKLMAKMQVNKLAAKSGVTGDKTLTLKRRTDAFNAYLTGTTSYNVHEATVNANNLASKSYQSGRYQMLGILLIFLVIVSIITTKMLPLLVSLIAVVLDYFTDLLPGNRVFHVISLMYSSSFTSQIVNAVIAFIELVIDHESTVMYRHVLYLILTCLVSLI